MKEQKFTVVGIIRFVFAVSLILLFVGSCDNVQAGTGKGYIQKIKVKKTGWYDIYNPSDSMEVLMTIQKKKNDHKGAGIITINKKKKRIYLNKGSYYLDDYGKRNPGESIYLISPFDKKVKLKYIQAYVSLKPNKKLIVCGDTRKKLYVKFKASRTGVIHIEEEGFRSFGLEKIALCDSKKKVIASDLYSDNRFFGVQKGKTYYFKLKFENYNSDTTYFRYVYDKNWLSSSIKLYGKTKETAVSLNSFSGSISESIEYNGLIGLGGKPETHWYVYDLEHWTPQHGNISVYWWEALGWMRKNGCQVDLYDQNGALLKDEDRITLDLKEEKGVSKVYVKVTAQPNCATWYVINFE